METEKSKTGRFLCHGCAPCMGFGCRGQMPGMGGPDGSRNFILNCKDWAVVRGSFSADDFPKELSARIRLAPMTGAVENMGFPDERQFYRDMVFSCLGAGASLSLGDGCPDEKLLFGIEAVRAAQEKDSSVRAAVFIKPYENGRILERMEWADGIMDVCGIDIDSYNIVTMRNKVSLEKKTAAHLAEIQRHLCAKGIPFAVKGVFTKEDIDLVTELKPDIVYVSNHGGRVSTREGSVAQFLAAHRDELTGCCHELWVDGGIRTKDDALTAQALGARCVLMGRPFVTALCYGGASGIASLMARITGGAHEAEIHTRA